MKHTLNVKGAFVRDGKVLACPYSPVLMVQGKVGGVMPERFPCGTQCPLFELARSNDGIQRVTLHCGEGAVYDVEVEIEKPALVL